MKTLIFNGSPHKDGDTTALINALAAQLKGEVRIVDAWDGSVAPCSDCRFCSAHDHCSISDAMDGVYRDIDAADNIVIASPLYFSELTGPLLSVLSRLQFFWIAKNIRKVPALTDKPRSGFILLVGGGDGTPDKALSTAKMLLKHMGAKFADCAVSHATDRVSAGKDPFALEAVARIARTINTRGE